MSQSHNEHHHNISEQLQTHIQESVTAAFVELQKDATNNQKLLEFVDNHYVETLNTPDLCAAVQRRLNPTNNHQSDDPFDNFLRDLSWLHKQQLMMRVTLHSFDKTLAEKLDSIAALKKASCALFTAAAVVSACLATADAKSRKPAAAAAGASILFCGVGKWVHMLLDRRERAVVKQKETIGAMVLGAKSIIKHVSDIYAVARRLQLETGSLSETGDDAAVKKVFQELQGKALVYSQDMKWVKQVVIQTIIKLA